MCGIPLLFLVLLRSARNKGVDSMWSIISRNRVAIVLWQQHALNHKVFLLLPLLILRSLSLLLLLLFTLNVVVTHSLQCCPNQHIYSLFICSRALCIPLFLSLSNLPPPASIWC